MILNYIIAGITRAIDYVFSHLPNATVLDLPFGEFIYDALVSMVLTWNAFIDTWPYGIALYQVFVFGIIPFELAVLTIRLVLGSRSPVMH